MPTTKTPLLYLKDDQDGRSSNACTDDDFFFYQKILFKERTGS